MTDTVPTQRRGSGSGLTPGKIEELKSKGLNQSQIAQMFGVTRQAVSDMKRKYGGGSKTPREVVREHFPWRIPAALQNCSIHHRMADHAEFVATGGRGMSEDKLRRLAGFYQRLEAGDLVVEYDPEIPPSDTARCGGWAYRNRVPDDGKLMIRVNNHTNITPQGAVIWRIPKRRP